MMIFMTRGMYGKGNDGRQRAPKTAVFERRVPT
jgi:hypothetical protein